jgi:hypothetical protein
MQPAALIVCERTGNWAAAWRRAFGRSPLGQPQVPIVETRSLDECRQSLRLSPASFVSLELTAANLDSICELLSSLERQFPAAIAVVTAARSLDGCEPIVRELGALHFVSSPRALPSLASIVRRHLARQPRPDRDPAERIRASLPWARQ